MVNVIIPVYKGRETLPYALDSLVSQTMRMFIVTIVQDCDGEDYSDIVDEYTRRGLKIKLLQTPENLGPGGARQFGMDHETMCDYFMFLDADDMYYPRTVEVLYKEAKKQGADLINSTFVVERGENIVAVLDVDTTPVTWTHGKIYRAEYLRENKIRFLDELRLNEDSYFNLVAVNSTDKKFKIKEPTYLWRDNKNSLTRSEKDETFFQKSWEQYLLSQAQGIIDIERIRGTIPAPLVAATLNNMYVHMMQAIYYKLPLDEAVRICKKLKNNKTILKCIEEAEFWQTIHNIVKTSILKETNIIFFKMRFCDWLNEFILDRCYEEDSDR